MTTVGIISDTHGVLSPRAYAALADCDAIIHAGDIGGTEILHELKTLAPVYAVLGNNDFDEYGAAVGRFARPCIDGVHFCVSHYPRDIDYSGGLASAQHAGQPIPQVRIHGHTHTPKLLVGADARPSNVVLCPGSASRPRRGAPASIAHLKIESGLVVLVQIESLTGDILQAWSR